MCVFFADVLGFGRLSESLAGGAEDSLAAMASLLSRDDILGKILNWPGWADRYGLSDSLFLVSSDAAGVLAAGAEIFFNVAYVTHGGPMPVLMRGGIAKGEVAKVAPLFPESAKANLVGPAVVQAVRLEKNPLKGPRLFVDEPIGSEIEGFDLGLKWLLDRHGEVWQVLWPLPPSPDEANGRLIGEVCAKALDLVERRAGDPEAGGHYLGYLDVVIRSLFRLLETRPEQGSAALASSHFKERADRLERLFMSPELLLVDLMRELARR